MQFLIDSFYNSQESIAADVIVDEVISVWNDINCSGVPLEIQGNTSNRRSRYGRLTRPAFELSNLSILIDCQSDGTTDERDIGDNDLISVYQK